MDANGKCDQIHISQQTADELIKAGTSDLIVPHSESIKAKGKRRLQMHWLVFNYEVELSGFFANNKMGQADKPPEPATRAGANAFQGGTRHRIVSVKQLK